MTSKFRYCRQCGERFEYKRDDQQFHSPACVAQFYRDNPNPQYIHAANLDEYWHTCEWCGVDFFVNGYAERGGKRTPKYHSNACKQAAYRARGQETQDQAARRPKQKSSAPPPPPPPPPPPQPPPPRAKATPEPQWKYVGTSRRDPGAVSEAKSILGVPYDYTDKDLRQCYRIAITKWHPDRNPSPFATAWSQAINWAYDYLNK